MDQGKKMTVALTAAVTAALSAGAFTAFADDTDIPIDESTFPDEAFRTYVQTCFGESLSQDEIANATAIDVSYENIARLDGIQYFTNLTELNCSSNQLTELDVSQNTALETLICGSNDLESLALSSNDKLIKLHCNSNELTRLDVSNNTKLTDINCGSNDLGSLNLSSNADLEILECNDIGLTVLDLSSNTNLETLNCFDNHLESLDLTYNTKLQSLNCSFNNTLKSLVLSQDAPLSDLSCQYNQLTSLDLSQHTSLTNLSCEENQLTSLDVKGCTSLIRLSCSNNQLTSLNVKGCSSLDTLDCSNNQLTSLDVSECDSDIDLSCNNQTYSIGAVVGSYPLTTLPGSFDPDKATNWLGATYDSTAKSLSDFTEALTVTYDYSCRNNQTMAVTLSVSSYTNPDDGSVAIDKTNFPDDTFREYVKSFDKNNDSKLSQEEIAAVTVINVNKKYIGDLTGIEYFTALEKLNCSENAALTSLDVSKNTALKELKCNNCYLKALDVSSCTALTYLNCSENYDIASLDVSKNTELEYLYCGMNKIGGSLDLSKNTRLKGLDCSDNCLTSLNVKSCNALSKLSCEGNEELEELDASGCTALEFLFCSKTQLKSLDVSSSTLLKELQCYKSKLTSLDVSGKTSLEILYCDNNELTKLNVSGCTALTKLECNNNQLTSLDLNGLTALNSVVLDNQTYSVGDLEVSYDLSQLPAGFVSSKASNWQGADCENGVLKNFTSDSITYDYDCGNSRTMTVTLAVDSYTNTDEVEINTANFPDSTFRTYVKTLDTDNSGKLSKDEINAVTEMRIYNQGIADLTGIEHFTALTKLVCDSNQLTELDVSKNTALTKLSCSSNQLTSLDVSGSTTLTELSCYSNQLKSLNASGCTALTDLYCQLNQITSLDVSGCNALVWLDCESNQLTSLDVSGFKDLTKLRCNDNKLTSLNVSGCAVLEFLSCQVNSLTSLDLTGCTKLTEFYSSDQKYYIESNGGSFALDDLPGSFDPARASNWAGAEYVSDSNMLYNFRTGTVTYTYDCGNGRTMDVTLADSNFEVPINETNFPDPNFRQYVKELANGSDVLSRSVMDSVVQIDVSYKGISSLKGIEYFAALKTLKCYNNNLTSLDVSSNTKLVELRCSSNQISSLKLNREIENLSCNFNQLTSLDLSGFDYLMSLEIASNKLTSLKLKDCDWLETLSLSSNQLTSLDLTDCTEITRLNCSDNNITSLDLTGCTELEKLDCSFNQLKSLDVSGLKYLTTMNCKHNQLTSLSVRNLNMLTTLNCSENQLTGLDVYGCTALTKLVCSDNQLTSLDVYNCTALTTFFASGQTYPIAEVIDTYPLTNLPEGFEAQYADGWSGAEYDKTANALKNFTANSVTYNYDCGNNYKMNVTLSIGAFRSADDVAINEKNFPDPVFRKYVSDTFDTNGNGYLSKDELAAVTKIEVYNKDIYDLTGVEYFTDIELLNCANDKVTRLDVSRNTKLKELALPNNQLTSLDISKNTELIKLNCYNNKLTALDLSNNTKLEELYCGSNRLTELDVSKNTELTRLDCYTNKLTALDVSNNAKLKILNFDNNQIAELDVSKNTALTWLECSENLLASLNLSQNTALTILGCNDNRLTSLDLSNNTALTSTYLAGNSFDIGEVTKTYDLANLPAGFDSSKASNWQGAVCENGVLTGFTANTITYTYNCGNGISTVFTLNAAVNEEPQDPISAFVERLYTKLLGRPSDASGKENWVSQLLNGSSAVDVSLGFVYSEEFKNRGLSNEETVTVFYNTFLDRAPDEGGLKDWTSKLDNGCSLDFLFRGFTQSAEFNNICESYGINRGSFDISQSRDKNVNLTAYVSRMYTKAFERPYDVDGLNNWTGLYLEGKTDANGIARGFIYSEEFSNRALSDEAYVETLYQTFFDRASDPDGKANWLGQLRSGASRNDVLDGFLGSAEYANLVAGFEV